MKKVEIKINMKRKSLTDLEIKEQYNNGYIQLAPMMENLIDKFKNDKNSLDIQQLQLVTAYLIADRDFDENYIELLGE